MKELNVLELPLSGQTIVEANAGTGKTWSVTGIYLRLLLETELELAQILVMTFTRAATAELRSRLHSRITLMLARLEDATDTPGQDQLIEDLLLRLTDRKAAADKLERSLRTFDLAAIYTIHGFCNQVLSRFCFSTGFDPELENVENELDYLEPLIRAGWRDLCRQFSPGFAEFVHSKRVDCMKLGRRCVEQWERPWRNVIAVTGPETKVVAAEAALETAALELRHSWRTSKTPIVAMLAETQGLNRRSYNDKLLNQAYAQIERVCAGQSRFDSQGLSDLARLGNTKITAACLKNAEPLSHPFFDNVDRFVDRQRELAQVHELRYRALWLELLEQISDKRIDFKRRLRIRSYSDLLLDLQAALAEDSEGELAANISRQFPAALVDEFQDTDPAQYEILAQIYQQSEAPLIFVGDPKQALYGFRGADVFAYLEARNQATRIYSLSSNWRAVPRLIQQVNALFSLCKDPFLISDIGYKSSSAGAIEHPPLTLENKPAAALEFLLLPGNEKGARAAKDETTSLVAASVASNIAELIGKGLSGDATIGDRNLQASDIAVLVRSHKQAKAIVQALSEHSVSCTQIGTSSIWLSAEAFELALICRAIITPEAHGAVAAALSTPLLGVLATEIRALLDEEQKMDQAVARFHGYRRLWQEHGLSSSLHQLMSDYEVTRRVLSQPAGERSLTNLTHLQDLLQAHAFATACTPGELLEWFKLQRLGSEAQIDEALLRLESDEDLVRVLTIHKSKGLQFPIVFCPFLWAASSRFESRDWVEYHQPGRSRSASLDLGGPDYRRHRELALHESFAEEIRVLYVALTRAIHQCVVAWGQVVGAENSPLRYLLHSEPAEPGWRSGISAFKKMQPVQVQQVVGSQLDQVGVAWRLIEGSQQTRTPIVLGDDTELGVVARKFDGRVPRAWQVYSYSSIAAHEGFGIRDHDATAVRQKRPSNCERLLNIFEVPGGPDVGSMFHEILEELTSFNANAEEILDLTRNKAHKYRLDRSYVELVAEHIQECLVTPLSAADPSLSLATIHARERVVEMEFHLSLAACKLQDIRRIAALRPGSGRLGKGFLRGYIDLVFCYKKQYFIVDYKSNHLGDEQSDYEPEALRLAIRSSDYDLQYHLYCVALHRFLRLRLVAYDYDRHFGGVYYLYLRGMRKASGPLAGIHFDRPERSVIEGLDQLFGA